MAFVCVGSRATVWKARCPGSGDTISRRVRGAGGMGERARRVRVVARARPLARRRACACHSGTLFREFCTLLRTKQTCTNVINGAVPSFRSTIAMRLS
jgi:hypothetical protein